MPFTRETAQAAGAVGGRATAQRHGRDHMQRIGKRGFRATVRQRHVQPDGTVTYDAYAWLLWRLGYTPRQQRAS
jgi:hypothetical protein